jgi:hypothetical protein
MSKNTVEPEGSQVTSRYGAYELHAGEARLHARTRMHSPTRSGTHTHGRAHARTHKYVILIACSRQQWFANVPQYYVIPKSPVLFSIFSLMLFIFLRLTFVYCTHHYLNWLREQFCEFFVRTVNIFWNQYLKLKKKNCSCVENANVIGKVQIVVNGKAFPFIEHHVMCVCLVLEV